MARTAKWLLCALIISIGITNPASAAIKSGDECKKLGQIATVNGKKLICKKSGKNLFWTIEKTKQQTSTRPNPVNSNPAKSPEITFPTSPEIEKVELLLANLMASTKAAKSKVELIVGPGSENRLIAEIIQENIDVSLKFTEALGFELSRDYKVYVGDRDWLTPLLPADTWCSSSENGVPAGSSAGYCGRDNGIIFVNRTGFLFNGTNPIPRDFTKGEDRRLISTSFAHEIFHAMQEDFHFKSLGNKGNFNPMWLNEGGANVVSALALAVAQNISYREARTWIVTYRNCMENPNQWKLNDFIFNTGKEGVCGPYFAGFLWSEFLIAETGDIGALLNLAKINRSKLDKIPNDPKDLNGYERQKLAVSLADVYGLAIEQFIPKAEAYSVKSANEMRTWAIAKGIYYN